MMLVVQESSIASLDMNINSSRNRGKKQETCLLFCRRGSQAKVIVGLP